MLRVLSSYAKSQKEKKKKERERENSKDASDHLLNLFMLSFLKDNAS